MSNRLQPARPVTGGNCLTLWSGGAVRRFPLVPLMRAAGLRGNVSESSLLRVAGRGERSLFMEGTVDQIQEKVTQAKSAYDQGRRALNDLTRTATEKSKQALTLTDGWVHDNPWLALGL